MKYDFKEYEIPIEIQKYSKEWDEYFENHRNVFLEEKINNNQIEVDVYYDKNICEKCSLDFGYKYKENNDLDERYDWTRKALRYLFENNYKWFYLSKKSNLYKTCVEVGNHLIHSPYKERNKEIFILQNDNKLFCILGLAFYHNNYTEIFFGYIGEMGRKTLKQSTIFDYIKENA